MSSVSLLRVGRFWRTQAAEALPLRFETIEADAMAPLAEFPHVQPAVAWPAQDSTPVEVETPLARLSLCAYGPHSQMIVRFAGRMRWPASRP